MIEKIIENTDNFIKSISKVERKKIGQFFTSPVTARFMASLFAIPYKPNLTVLDAGAGSGILSAALMERLDSIEHIERVELTCYEIDEKVLPLLETTLKVTKSSKEQFNVVKSLIAKADYIVNAGDPDREGQLLIDEVLEYVGNTKPVKRILLNALDEKSVKHEDFKLFLDLADEVSKMTEYDLPKYRYQVQKADAYAKNTSLTRTLSATCCVPKSIGIYLKALLIGNGSRRKLQRSPASRRFA